MNLAEYQERLASQYARLSKLRATESYPVYAIEHGLTDDERAVARKLLNADLSSARRADRMHWLVWIAAAAEVGYAYDGTEYWDSFSAAFPLWPNLGDRNQIRAWYKRFASEYGGVKPSGLWARQFPIIAWPITQAILPRYLQRHFAEHLYELRHVLVRRGGLTLDEIGDLLSERYYGHSSRFEGFLQQKTLTARIVMALRLENVADAIAPIEAATLDRIVADFDRLGQSGSRLREARRVLREARFINSHKAGFIPKTADETLATSNMRNDQPKLIARPLGSGQWRLSIVLPDLAIALRHIGLTPRDLEQSRMRFRSRGKGSPWIPGRALFAFTGHAEEALSDFPTANLPVLEFEKPHNTAVAAITDRLIFTAEPIKLLKIRADGAAVEISGRHVRAAQSYVLCTVNQLDPEIVRDLALSPLQTATPSVCLWLLDVPEKLGSKQINALKALGLGYRLGARIDPVGLCPRWNAVTGALILLDSESAIFCVTADVAVREFQITVDGNTALRAKPTDEGSTLIGFGNLPAGNHKVAVSALGAATGSDLVAEEITIEVRGSLPWQQSIAGKAGVTFAVEPRDSTLVELLDGVARIRVRAPAGRTAKFDAKFFGPNGDVFSEHLLGKHTAPIADDRLLELSRKLTSEALIDNLERASRVDLVISLDEFGSDAITFEKMVEPLRWLRVDDRTVRLADDTGGDALPVIESFELDAVEVGRAVDYEQASQGVALKGKGALLVATYQKERYEVVATALQKSLTDFRDLAVPANVSQKEAKPARLLNALRKWQEARRLIGPMAFIARRNAVLAMERCLEASLCGEDWARIVSECRTHKRETTALYPRVYHSFGFAAGLRAYEWRYATEQTASEVEFVRLARVYRVSEDAALCRLALQLAFAPWDVRKRHLPTNDAFDVLTASTALIRGAYFARLAADLRPRQALASEAA